jgi:hypothetical protein
MKREWEGKGTGLTDADKKISPDVKINVEKWFYEVT